MVTLLLLALTSSLLFCPDIACASYQEQEVHSPSASSLAQDAGPISVLDTIPTAQEKPSQAKSKKPKKQKKRGKQKKKAMQQPQKQNPDQAAISAALSQARTKQESTSAQKIQHNDSVVATACAPHPIKERYTLVPGSFLRQIRAFCGQAGWQLIWQAKRDLEISSTASYIAPFEDALRVIFADLARSGQAFRVTLYKANSVVEVRDD